MKFLIVFIAIVAVAMASSVQEETITNESQVSPEGYTFNVATNNGFEHSAEGKIDNENTEHGSLAVHGHFKYVGDDGVTYEVRYIADENGFQPIGAHIPQPLDD
ncbi:larval cuticle protein 65Ag1-like [Drosophila nasuta]|uniref:larval cuticle protein 65Ag1-like n=1 Tax=Drosophila nasuta TaxID=42062 RepID=UPI00295ED112|nr:larval cuticle protein 65Ag1-like [Drosophila nasuta]